MPAVSARRPIATYSIVARDAATGELGVAVQSHWFNTGSVVPWVEAGVGAVATQSIADPSYGSLGLDLMRGGKTAPETLKALLGADEGRAVRQVAMVDAAGRVAAHTGDRCIAAAGHVVDENLGVSCQANLMERGTVWDAMRAAYVTALDRGDDLADRLLAALDAAEAEGGDRRGKQSAALIVTAGQPTGAPWSDRLFDLRVEDDPEPLVELRRLVTLQRAYRHMGHGDDAIGAGRPDDALREYEAAHALAPGIIEIRFWTAVSLAATDRRDEALEMFREVFAAEPFWRDLLPELVRSGLTTRAAAERILEAT